MISTHPRFAVEIVPVIPVGSITHAVRHCPRCGCNMAISAAMREGLESIVCRWRLAGRDCNGHFYLRGSELEFVGTVQA